MNVQPCARCGYGVYPAEKINCIDQTWHKACFHCEVCKMMLTVNNFVSHEKKPYCQVHNPKNNAFTSVFETPININAKKLSEVVSEIKYREEGEQFKSAFQWDVKSRDIEAAYKAQQLASQNAYYAAYEGGTSWYSGNIPDPQMVRITQAQKTLNDFQYTEEYEPRRGKGSFPAMITPGYQVAKRATQLSSNVEYKRGHEERVSKFTSVVDTPDILHAKVAGQLSSDLKYTEDFEERRGKGSFPAMITPAYQIAKKANELASDVKYHQQYENEIKGKASHTAGTDVNFARENVDQYVQDYMGEYEEHRGKGSFPAMITPAYQNAKKANELASDIKYKKDLSKMKGAAHFHSLTAEDNLVLKQAQSANKLVSEVEYKKDLGNNSGYSINYCDTPQFKNVSKISKYTSDLKYRETYQNQMKGHYIGTGMDKRMLHAMKVGNLASNIAYKSDYKHDGVDYNYPATLTPSYQTTRKLVPLKDVNYRQSIDKLKYSSVASTPQIAQAKINAQQLSDLNYRAQYEKTKTNYTLPQDVPQLVKAKANAELYSEVKYKEGWEKSKGQGFEMKLDSLPLLAAKASRDLASDIKYKEEYEKTKGKAIGTKDSRLLHSLQVAKMSSEIAYKKDFEESKTHFHLPMDMVNLRHAKKAQALASDLDYRKRLHEYTVVPEDMKTKWAKKAYGLQSDLQYRSDLMWMKGVGCITEGSLNIQHAKNVGDLVSEKKYRQKVDALKFTSVADSSQIKHAKKSQELQSDNRYRADLNWMKGAGWIATGSLNVEQAKKAGELISERLYKEHGESVKHQYTPTTDFPELLLAKLNSMNISEIRYKESWGKMKDGGYQMKLDAIPFQAAKASGEIISDLKYKEAFEKMKGQMVGSCGLDGDIHIAHSVHASSLQSDVKYKQGFEDTRAHFHLPLDMINLVHARKAQSLVSEQEYRQLLHQYTSLTDDLRLQCAKNAYKLQSENLYRSDMNFMRGVGCITPGALEIEGKKKASELISESKYRQQPHSFKYTSVTDSPGLLHAKFSNMIANERLYKAAGEDSQHHYTPTLGLPEFTRARINAANLSDAKYRESWHNLRAQGYKLTTEALPFQTARASREIASDYQYKYNFVMERGKHIGARSVLDDTRLLHCLHAAKLQSEQEYKKGSQGVWSQYHLPMDMVNLVHARKAQALASDQDYRKRLHEFTALPEDMKMKWAKKAHMLQSEHRYKSDLNFMKGVGWMALRSPQIESVKKAGELISETKYRQKPESLKFTSVVDSPDLIHAKNSYLQCSDRLYKAGDSEAMHKYTLPPDHPDFIRARQNALHISDKVYKTSWEQTRASGYDFRIDAIPFQTAKASREIASDYKYRETFLRGRGQQIGFLSANDDPKIRHVLRVGKLQSDNQYRSGYAQNRAQFHSHLNQPGFLHAKRSQQLASNVNYKQPLHEYTCDPEQLNVKHAKQAYKLQSDVKYKSDLNWLRGIGWTPPGSYKVEMARRAAELAYLRDMAMQAASAQYGPQVDQLGAEGSQQVTVNPDASEILQVKRRKIHLYK
ncbi:nebulin-related-anchoring protein isoform X5 [Oxyura jamaicensis]|uniref:nebulin-related-anchoring protein isoform X5 n=1 Tax=Oxyura jamaicensis TaxID=8884 RepID=UPI0015A63F94|nr:nebulin-related-anchoring protein isoform X5 [Oxyura jamaicensis]